MKASNVVWSDETAESIAKGRPARFVRFTGTPTDHPNNVGLHGTHYDGATYGGNESAGYVEYVDPPTKDAVRTAPLSNGRHHVMDRGRSFIVREAGPDDWRAGLDGTESYPDMHAAIAAGHAILDSRAEVAPVTEAPAPQGVRGEHA